MTVLILALAVSFSVSCSLVLWGVMYAAKREDERRAEWDRRYGRRGDR